MATLARRILTRAGSFVVCFHAVAARRYAGLPAAIQPAFDVAELRAAVDWIAGRFEILSPEELLRGEKPGVLLTFDDGFANHATNALPVLEDLEAPAVFFVTAQHVREPRNWLPATRDKVRRHWPAEDEVPESIARDLFDGMSPAQLSSCAEHPLVTIGSHTVHHTFLTRCDDATLRGELVQAKALLEQWCARPVELFAYPAGDYDARVAGAVRTAGYRAAFAEDPVGIGVRAYEIPRIGLYRCDSPYLAAKLSGLHRRALPLKSIIDLA